MSKTNLLAFIHLAEKLKTEKRNGHTSNGNPESVADHCWRVSLMVMLFGSSLDNKIDMEKALKLSIIHDLAEIITGDASYFLFFDNEKLREEKHINEKKAITLLAEKLPKKQADEILSLWNEFEESATSEAKFVLAIDKMEAQIQHNEAPFKNWTDYDIKYAPTLLDKYCNFDSFLENFKLIVQEESKSKILSAKTPAYNN